jgi:hypothetical protein
LKLSQECHAKPRSWVPPISGVPKGGMAKSRSCPAVWDPQGSGIQKAEIPLRSGIQRAEPQRRPGNPCFFAPLRLCVRLFFFPWVFSSWVLKAEEGVRPPYFGHCDCSGARFSGEDQASSSESLKLMQIIERLVRDGKHG